MSLRSSKDAKRSNAERCVSGIAGLATLVALGGCGSSNADGPKLRSGPTLPEDSGSAPTFGQSDGGAATNENCARLSIGIFGTPGDHASSNFQAWLAKAGTSTTRVQTQPNEVLTSEVLAPFDVVVLDFLRHEYSPAEASAFETWVAAGKGVVSLTGYLGDGTTDFRANALLAPLGVAYMGSVFDGPVTRFGAHPITHGLTSVTFLGGYVIVERGRTTATRNAIATTETGNVGYAVELGKGRVFVWGDEWIEYDSEWTTLVEIEQLWVKAFAWLAPNRCKLTTPK